MDEITIKISSNGYCVRYEQEYPTYYVTDQYAVFQHTEDLLLWLIDRIPHFSREEEGDEVILAIRGRK